MNNKAIFKELGIKPGDSLSNEEITQISRMRREKETKKPASRTRAREAKGQFKGDDPETPENEAWEEG
ncbi:MAG: hypothetical protein GY832_17560 [Chloroflexi bacterium]|nr:hypothetical protein [Chloroflexota bacterium]